MRSTRRRGSVLIIVLLLLTIFLMLGFGQSRLASGAALEARRAAAFDAAGAAARGALEIAHHRISLALNDPTNDPTLYGALRTGLQGFSVAVPVLDVPALVEALAADPGLTVEDGCVRCDVSPQLPASAANPTLYDRHGALRLSVAVVHDDLGVVCRLAESYELRVALTTAPRPFDLTTFFLGDSSALLSMNALGGNPNATITAALTRLGELRDTADNLRTNFESLRATIAGVQDARAQAPLAAVVQALGHVDDLLASMPQAPVLVQGTTPQGPDSICYFPPLPFSLCTMDDRVSLADLDMPTRVGAALDSLRTIEPPCEAALAELRAFFSTAAPDLTRLPDLTRAWTGAAASSAQGWALVTRLYQGLQGACLVVAGPAYEALVPFLAAVEPQDYRRQASVTVVGGGGIGVAEGLDALLSRGEALNGLVYVDNPGETLVLDRSFTGDLVLVVTGDVTLARATVEDPSRDRLTVVAFGRMLVEGPVQGALVAWGPYEGTDGATVDGTLVLAGLTPDRVPSSRTLAGFLQRNPTVAAGPETADRTLRTVDVTRQTATLSPYAVLAEATRR